MLPRKAMSLIKLSVLCLVAALLSGCFLRSMFGRVVVVEDFSTEINEIFTAIFGDSTVAVCSVPGVPGVSSEDVINCTYIIDGEKVSSTVSLVSEFGLQGVLLDPVILQVPDNVISITATFTPTGGSGQPAVTLVRQTFEMQPFKPITAEVGTKFLIMDFPDSVASMITATNPISGPHFDFALGFAQQQPISQTIEPVSVKAMLTAKVVSRGHIYYAPLFPCVTSFADIPSMTIPVTDTAANLQVEVGDLIRLGSVLPCNHKFYDYTNTPPPSQYRVYLPIILR